MIMVTVVTLSQPLTLKLGDPGLIAVGVVAATGVASVKCLEALRAGEEAIEAVSQIRIGKDPLHLRIGLHIGLVLTGDFGSVTRHQFTLIGPEVNKAARLEQEWYGDDGGTSYELPDFEFEQRSPAGDERAHFRADRADTYRHVLDESDALGRRTMSLSTLSSSDASAASTRGSFSRYLCSCQARPAPEEDPARDAPD